MQQPVEDQQMVSTSVTLPDLLLSLLIHCCGLGKSSKPTWHLWKDTRNPAIEPAEWVHPLPACVHARKGTQDNVGWSHRSKISWIWFFSSMKEEIARLKEHVLYGLCRKSTWWSLKGLLYSVPSTIAVLCASRACCLHGFITVGGTGCLTPGENSDENIFTLLCVGWPSWALWF